MSSKIYSVELAGLEGQLVEIEVDTRMSIPSFSIVGLPDAAVMEARERVMSAVKNAGYPLPRGRIVVNLAPANIKKVGPRYDLPIALGLIAFSNLIPVDCFKNTVFLGELALDGHIRPIAGVLVSAEHAWRMGFQRIVVPKENAREAAIINGIEVVPVGHLKDAIQYLNKQLSILPIQPFVAEKNVLSMVDMAMIKGQVQAKRALEIAAAGGHNVLMKGVPGAGKTLLARALQSILPAMTQEEMLEVTRIYSVAGQLPKSQSLISSRPFRVVHHTASAVSIVGGGSVPMPGEITLAHHGVLFLDEVAEFPQEVLNVLRQPIEDGYITINRANARATYPAKFSLVAAMNPCPCGYHHVQKHQAKCQCPAFRIRNYHQRLSGPFLDRIDIHLKIEPVEHEALACHTTDLETSAEVRKRVNRAYKKQILRFKNHAISRNAEMNVQQIEQFCALDAASKNMLHLAIDHLGFSARAYYRAIKMARTIADLDNSEPIHSNHVSEALQYLYKKKY
ncbi:YifB family Mg chelatase-like AAA ATPase [Candidatus Peregrinibacteria bacterium]|nr:YifB family Mg chelatase-like AAA ATPase [Candidatus Peregrinibacteria bacterium]